MGRTRAPHAGESPLGTWAQRVIGAFTLVLVVSILIRPRMSTTGYNQVFVGLGCVLIVGIGVLGGPRLGRVLRAHPGSARSWDVLAAALVVIGTLCAVLVGWGSAYQPTWDAERIAIDSLLPPSKFGVLVHAYYSWYPNNAAMMATARVVRHVGPSLGLSYQSVFVAINSVSFAVTAAALYLTVRMVRGPRWGTAALVPLILLIALSVWVSIPYTDMLALWSPMSAICFFVAALRRTHWRRYLLLASGGLALGVGYGIKTTPIVGLPAVLIVLCLLSDVGDRCTRWKALRMAGTVIAAMVIGIVVLGAWARPTADLGTLTPNISRQPLAFVADGQTIAPAKVTGRPTYGAWSAAVSSVVNNHTSAVQDLKSASIIIHHIAGRGVVGELKFEAIKAQFNWGDATFWARGEGTDLLQTPLRHDRVANVVNAFDAPTGRLWNAHTALANILWFSMLVGVGIGLVRSRYDPDVLLLSLTMAGIGIFLLIFQDRSRYLIDDLPVVIALAACVLPRLTKSTRDPIRDAPQAPSVTKSQEHEIALGRRSGLV